MTAPRLMPVLCACSWTGALKSDAPCPACHRPCYDRVTAQRLGYMRSLIAGMPCSIPARARIRMIEIGPITAARPPRAAGGNGTKRPPERLRCVTSMGMRVIAAVDHAEHATKREPEGAQA